MQSIDMDVGLDEVKVELDVVQQLDMLTQLTSSKVHNEGSPNISPRSTAARVLVSIMPEPRGLQHNCARAGPQEKQLPRRPRELLNQTPNSQK